MEGYIGQIVLFAGNFAPKNWAFCNGQILAIAQNTALFSILGTTYGGDGKVTFALPDLRGRVPVHVNTSGAPTLPVDLGQMGGSATVTLNISEIPAHNHSLNGNTSGANLASPQGGIPAVLTDNGGSELGYNLYQTGAPNTQMSPQAIGIAGQSQPHQNMQPYLGLNYIICLYGIFPSRN